LNNFSALELNEVIQRVGFEPDAHLVGQLQELTGGHPWLVSSLLNAILDGYDLDEIVKNPLSAQWNLGAHATHSFGVARALLGGGFTATLAALLRRGSIDSREIRETLWEAGAIRDPDENPPVCSAAFYALAASGYTDEPASPVSAISRKRSQVLHRRHSG
jgi:hypothetical protein